jgi:ribonuclease-3
MCWVSLPGRLFCIKTALTHRSVKEGSDQNNERLEYLGDAVLSAIIADFLFKKYPYKEEGFDRNAKQNGQSQPA